MSDTGRRRSYSSRNAAPQPGGLNSILIFILTIIVIASSIGGFVVSTRRSTSRPAGDRSETAESSIEVVEGQNKLELNKYPEVNELIANYRKAFQDGDTELLKKVYNTDEDINQSILTGTSAVIEGYENTQYHTKRGIRGDEYVAFVYDDLKLADISTLAPNLSVFYIKTADNGSLYIYRGEFDQASGTYVYDAKTQEYLDKMYQDDDVIELITTVNTKMDSACAKDEALMNFMEKLRSQTDDSVAPSGGDDSQDETTAEESSAETGTEAETVQSESEGTL